MIIWFVYFCFGILKRIKKFFFFFIIGRLIIFFFFIDLIGCIVMKGYSDGINLVTYCLYLGICVYCVVFLGV